MINTSPILLSTPRLQRRLRHLASSLALAALAAAGTASAQAPTAPVELQPDAPDRHVVVKGDTLWHISGKFLTKPWRWPEIWRLNRDQIRNPHLIYPGQVVVLDRNAEGGPRLRLEDGSGVGGPRPVVKLSPHIRAEAYEDQAVPSIPVSDIDPFIVQNTVVGAEELDNAPQIVRSTGERVAFSATDSVYAVGITPESGKNFLIFRKGRELRDPSIPERKWWQWRHNEPDPQIIGYEGTYLGEARLVNEGDVAKLEIINTRQEVQIGDVLLPIRETSAINYVPHAPDFDVDAVVMTLPSGVSEAGRTSVVTFNRGKKHGIESGHVLAAFKPTEDFSNPRYKPNTLEWAMNFPAPENKEPKTLQIPEERVGLVFVYRAYDNISYGLVMNTGKENVKAGYKLRKP